jgi:hypothetical protein
MIALEIVKAGRKKSKVQGKNGPLEMKPADIPDGLLMECRFGMICHRTSGQTRPWWRSLPPRDPKYRWNGRLRTC